MDDPYLQGRVGCANVLSDLYAMGVVDCENVLMILAVSSKMTDEEKDIVTTRMMQGFKDLANEAETDVRGGQTVVLFWLVC